MAGPELGRYRRLVQYFWDPEPVNDKSAEASIWCLGKEYKAQNNHLSDDSPSNEPQPISKSVSPEKDQSSSSSSVLSSSIAQHLISWDSKNKEFSCWPIEFLDDFETRILLTYRSGFPPIPRIQHPKKTSSLSIQERLRNQLEGAAFTSDTGWGCMIRSGQSLLANTLLLLQFGRDWRRGPVSLEEKKIISLFADDPRAPFSIHKFVEHGTAACGKQPGEWFGPSATARCIQVLTTRCELSNLSVYVTGDSLEVYEDNFMAAAKPDGINFKPTLILIGTRLGLENITPVYWEALKASLQMSQSIGIAGGHPSSSHYFVAVQDYYFFYLDPHNTQPALNMMDDMNNYSQEEIESCHTRRLRRAHIKEMDPSMLIAFLIRSEKDWMDWRKNIQEFEGKAIIRVADVNPFHSGHVAGRNDAVDEVETFDDENEDDEIVSSV
ncbi:putative cysteine protease atg4 [Erysiphe necator]|uniref:Cysteine protease n=1 Tax=Uncinula necator TaxID=52586 RepID=A0A0B1P556_UNCNE|nr:putative cysteine protease atg4 [Erysiphe necator]